MKNSEEILKVCDELGVNAKLVPKAESSEIINAAFDAYDVRKKSGHLAIHTDTLSLPLEEYEFSYPAYLKNEPAYMFFDQENINKEEVIAISEVKRIGEVMEHSYGMEYFLH